MTAVLTEEDFRLFTKWKMGAFGEKLREICEDDAYDALTFEEKMRLCIDTQAEARTSNRIAKMCREARFKQKDACVEDIVYLPGRSLSKDRVTSSPRRRSSLSPSVSRRTVSSSSSACATRWRRTPRSATLPPPSAP